MGLGYILTAMFEKDALNLAVSFFRPFLFTFLSYYFMRKIFSNRINRYTLVAIAFVFALWDNMRMHIPYGTGQHLGANIFINAFSIAIVIFLFYGKFWRKAIVYLYFDIIRRLCYIIAFMPISLYDYVLHDRRITWREMQGLVESNMSLRLIYIFTSLLLYWRLGLFSVKIWRKLLLEKPHIFYLLLIALPISQRYALSLVSPPSTGSILFSMFFFFTADAELSHILLSLIGASVSLAAAILLFYYILSYEKREAIEAELKETKRVMELEQAHYLEIERQSEKIAKIRHDINNQLTSVIQLIQTGEDNAAREMIADLSKEIEGTG